MTDYIANHGDSRAPYHREAVNVASQFETGAHTDGDLVVRWDSNDRVPPQDILDLWQHLGFIFDMAASQAAHEADTKAFLTEYRANQPAQPSDEERAEARAAFGPGTEVVDFFTGRKFTT